MKDQPIAHITKDGITAPCFQAVVPRLPGGRYRVDWQNSGEAFYEDRIRKHLRAGAFVCVDLDDAVGIPPGYMSEFTWRAVEEFGHDVKIFARSAGLPHRMEDFKYHMDRAKSKLPPTGLGATASPPSSRSR